MYKIRYIVGVPYVKIVKLEYHHKSRRLIRRWGTRAITIAPATHHIWNHPREILWYISRDGGMVCVWCRVTTIS